MEAFANTDDLKGYYRVMDAQEMQRAESLLEYASAKMLTYMARHGVGVTEGDEVQAAVLNGVCCSVVARAMGAAGGDEGFSAWGGNTVASASGDVYFTSSEKESMLGGRCGKRIGCIMPYGPVPDEGDDSDGQS